VSGRVGIALRRTDVTRSIRGSRPATLLLAGVAVASALLASGCGTGQISETAAMEPAVTGVNAQTTDNIFKIRNLSVNYPGSKGYAAGADAPLDVVIYNDSGKAVTVTVTTDSARAVVLAGGSASPSAPASASPSGSASASPSGSASASASASGSATPTGGASASASASPTPSPTPADVPASLQIPSGGFLVLNRASGRQLQLNGLNAALRPGQSVNLVFTFDGTEIKTPAPMGLPLTAAPPATPVVGGEGGGTGHGG
jgi:hypothetical protein